MQFRHFRFWCQHVLPLVYDNSLSYYEVLCKCVDYINHLIDDNKLITSDLDEIKNELEIIQNWINNFNFDKIEKIIEQYIATMIFVQINDDGYIVYYIPESWDNIIFNTTGLDINLDMQPEYGHLVLSY